MAKSGIKYISAITGRFVKKEYAEQHPETTVGIIVKIGRIKHRK